MQIKFLEAASVRYMSNLKRKSSAMSPNINYPYKIPKIWRVDVTAQIVGFHGTNGHTPAFKVASCRDMITGVLIQKMNWNRTAWYNVCKAWNKWWELDVPIAYWRWINGYI